jgi:hypothetical protein
MIFQMAEVAMPRELFRRILAMVDESGRGRLRDVELEFRSERLELRRGRVRPTPRLVEGDGVVR